jgi:hypothetical protein
LDVNNLHRSVATARYLFGRLHRKDDASRRVEEVLKDRLLDDATRHDALALRGGIALAEGRIEEATESLAEANEAATAGDLEAMLWDRTLIRELAGHITDATAIRDFATAWLNRAENDGDNDTKDEILKLGRWRNVSASSTLTDGARDDEGQRTQSGVAPRCVAAALVEKGSKA